jgi:hypothetical protein
MKNFRIGTTLIDLLISMAIVALLLGGVYLVYLSIEAGIANVGTRSAATAAIDQEIEMIRNLPYGSVGTIGGIPSGVIPQVQAVSVDNVSFVLQTTILNIDDPYDSSPSSSPVADYKLADITATCPTCSNFAPVEITTTVAPSLLAEGTVYGSIFISAIDANGNPVSGASMRVVNASVTPSINLTDTTNASGILKLIGVPTSTQGYQIFASKSGYSSAQTYPLGGAGNPNPIQPNITVASQTVSNVTFAIDRVSILTVSATDDRCVAMPNEPFSIQGSKLVGTNPNVVKYATSSQTGANGIVSFPAMEWDTYALTLADAAKNVMGTIPFSPVTINPSSTQGFQFILQPAANPSLLVTIADAANGGGISNADATLSKSGFSETLVTGHAALSQGDWSGGQYASQSGNINTSIPGALALFSNASSSYATGTVSSLISDTFDLGNASATLDAISWNPATQPAGTLLEFQLAVNNDDATWNFLGPDGTPSTYFIASSSVFASFSGNRYFRYEVFMSTQNPSSTPTLANVSFDFTGNCVPPAQVLFTGLSQGTYLADVTASNYDEATATVVVGPGFQSSTILMAHL